MYTEILEKLRTGGKWLRFRGGPSFGLVIRRCSTVVPYVHNDVFSM